MTNLMLNAQIAEIFVGIFPNNTIVREKLTRYA